MRRGVCVWGVEEDMHSRQGSTSQPGPRGQVEALGSLSEHGKPRRV